MNHNRMRPAAIAVVWSLQSDRVFDLERGRRLGALSLGPEPSPASDPLLASVPNRPSQHLPLSEISMSTHLWPAVMLLFGLVCGSTAVACPAANTSLTTVPSVLPTTTATTAPARPAAVASAEAMDSFFRSSLALAKDQLDGREPEPSPARSVSDARPPAFLVGDIDPVPTVGGGTTCGRSSTCSHFPTCGGGATCTNTCTSYPTCNGVNSMCASTCSNYPTCVIASGCTPTTAQWTTCNGNGQLTQACNSTCRTFPTCYSTCQGGPVATCDGQSPTCNSTTCAGAPTCSGAATCRAGGPCNVTMAPQSSCQGNPPSYCFNTCSGWATCAGFGTCQNGITCSGLTCGADCDSFQGLMAAGVDEGLPFSASLLAMGSLLVRRRRKDAADA